MSATTDFYGKPLDPELVRAFEAAVSEDGDLIPVDVLQTNLADGTGYYIDGRTQRLWSFFMAGRHSAER
jgi:uncharacterized ParB-like nuclease family protein